jgi:hypothetical protein
MHKKSLISISARDQMVLVVVHPGSACGSADFNYGSREIAEWRRQLLIEEWDNWRGGAIVLDGALTDELPNYVELSRALQDLLTRAGAGNSVSLRLEAPDPEQEGVLEAALQEIQLPKNLTTFVVTGAWLYPGYLGCVGGVYRALQSMEYRAILSSAALTE